MNVDLSKTKGLYIRAGSEASLLQPLQDIEQVYHIKFPGVICHHSPHNWDLHVDVTLLGKAGKQLCILRVRKRYSYNGDMPHYLFHSLITSLLTYAVSVRGCPSSLTYLCRIDKLQDRAVRLG